MEFSKSSLISILPFFVRKFAKIARRPNVLPRLNAPLLTKKLYILGENKFITIPRIPKPTTHIIGVMSILMIAINLTRFCKYQYAALGRP